MDISCLTGVGEKTALLLKNLGINNIKDLINFYPRSYEDWTNICSILLSKDRKKSCIKVLIKSKSIPLKLNSGKILYKILASDKTDDINIIFYNSKFLAQKLEINKEYFLMGYVTRNFSQYQIVSPKIKDENESDIIPIYNQCKGITSKKISSLVKNAFDLFSKIDLSEDFFDRKILEKYSLCNIWTALKNIHFPKNKISLTKARKRLIFNEFFWYHLNMKSIKTNARKSTEIKISNDFLDQFYSCLPFNATNAQKKVITECLNDMKNDLSMNRLLQGDVGSGKTAIAGGISYNVVKNGYQVALMVPTGLLALQHYKTFCEFFKKLNVNVEVIHGFLKLKEKNKIYENIQSGKTDIIIGTHALLSEKIIFKNLGLIITDEQHRFGVNQRATLVNKGISPHTLVMSATPIPRSLAMILYGDLDISVLNQLLPNRQEIETYHIDTKKRNKMFDFLNKLILDGGQAYIICASIDENENNILCTSKCKELVLKYGFDENIVEILHGKMKSDEKDFIMKNFSEGITKILISTTVIEVGIDIPNANIIIIENAERFGISQLHQLRGRVGRGNKKSYCILVSDSKSNDSNNRFSAMIESNDGFYLSEEDLKLRGPGDFFGTNQHGVPNIKMQTNYNDLSIIKTAQEFATFIFENQDILDHSEYKRIKKRLLKLNSKNILNDKKNNSTNIVF